MFHWSHHPDFYGRPSNWPTNEYNIWLNSKGEKYERIPYKNSPYVYTGVDKQYSQSHWCAEMAIEFIQAHRSYPENPWLFSLNFYDPHHDFDPPKDLLEKYIELLTKEDLPNYVPGELVGKPMAQSIDHEGAYGVKGNYEYDEMDNADHLLVKAAYYAMVEQMDIEVGRVIETLKQTNQNENTVIILSWEGHFLKGIERTALVELLDIAHTLLDLVCLPKEIGMQGKSLKELLTKSDCMDECHEYVYSEYYNAMRHGDTKIYSTMIANHKYKLSYCHSTNQGELYDLSNDSKETKNLYYDKDYTETKIYLLEQMANQIAYTIDPLPIREAVY